MTKSKHIETVTKMVADRKQQLLSCERIMELLQPEMDKFEDRDNPKRSFDTYVVRDYVDHSNAARTHRKEIEALEALIEGANY